MSENILKRAERIKDNEKLIIADTEKGPGDLFELTKYFSENGILACNSYRTPSLELGLEQIIKGRNGYNYYCRKDSDKTKVKKFIELMYTEKYGTAYNLELGQHTIAKAFDTGYNFAFPELGNISFRYTGKSSKSKLPVVKYDLCSFIPDEMKDKNGEFKFSFTNLKKFEEMKLVQNVRNSGGAITTSCRSCSRRRKLSDTKESEITGIVRAKNDDLFFRMSCTNCSNTELLMPLSLMFSMPTYPGRFRGFIFEIQLSPKYVVRTRVNGGSLAGKLYSLNSENYVLFSHKNWGKVLLRSAMEYANKKNIPVEVNKDVVVYR